MRWPTSRRQTTSWDACPRSPACAAPRRSSRCDVLYLPRYIWHHVQQGGCGEDNLSLNFWCGGKGNDAFHAAAAAAASAPPQTGAAPTTHEVSVEALSAAAADAAAEDAAFLRCLRHDAVAALTAFKAGRLAEQVAAKACGGGAAGGDFLTALAASANKIRGSSKQVRCEQTPRSNLPKGPLRGPCTRRAARVRRREDSLRPRALQRRRATPSALLVSRVHRPWAARHLPRSWRGGGPKTKVSEHRSRV